MNLEQFKDALIRTIYQHLRTISHDEYFYLQLNWPDHSSVALEITPTLWQLIHATDPSYKSSVRTLKPVYESLLKSIIVAEQGYELWQDVKAQINVLPGWWQIFAPLRPLNLALNDVLKNFIPSELKQEDDAVFKKKIEALIAEIKQLVQQIQQLVKKCNYLEEQLGKSNSSNEEIINELKEKYNLMEKKKNKYLQKYRDSKSLRLQEKDEIQLEHAQKTKELEDVIVIFAEELNILKQAFSSNKPDNIATPEIRPGNIQHGDSTEIMQRHNQAFRGRTPSRTSRFYQPARPAANEEIDNGSKLEQAPGL